MEFPTITNPYNGNVQIKHDITHHIETKGPPVRAKPWRLAPERLKIAKDEFQHMLVHVFSHNSIFDLHYKTKNHYKFVISTIRSLNSFFNFKAQIEKSDFFLHFHFDFSPENKNRILL